MLNDLTFYRRVLSIVGDIIKVRARHAGLGDRSDAVEGNAEPPGWQTLFPRGVAMGPVGPPRLVGDQLALQIFVYALDGRGKVGTGNFPFKVE